MIRHETATATASRGRSPPYEPSCATPGYTGRQVWNRQCRDEVLIDVDDVALGHETKLRWNNEQD